MEFNSDLFFRAVGLAFVLEGLCWALFPTAMRRAMLSLVKNPEQQTRMAGLAAIGFGLLIISLVHLG
ncbi:MAG: DUF2065 domain-containing protein [Desulfovibrio sp.]|nr:DUF2065 domain-containing protein [Desulfovibrio sp.]